MGGGTSSDILKKFPQQYMLGTLVHRPYIYEYCQVYKKMQIRVAAIGREQHLNKD